MNSQPLDEQYLTWLYEQVCLNPDKALRRKHWSLMRQIYIKEFIWLIPNDDNRVDDGRDLRHEFLYDYEIDDVDPYWLNLGCSMLEMLVALSRRMAFETDGEPHIWFWHMIEVLNLEQYNDKKYDDNAEEIINETIDSVIWRTYGADGGGSLFPLQHPSTDQRQVELWYQFSAYLLELQF